MQVGLVILVVVERCAQSSGVGTARGLADSPNELLWQSRRPRRRVRPFDRMNRNARMVTSNGTARSQVGHLERRAVVRLPPKLVCARRIKTR